jgi:hypothetical protein
MLTVSYSPIIYRTEKLIDLSLLLEDGGAAGHGGVVICLCLTGGGGEGDLNRHYNRKSDQHRHTGTVQTLVTVHGTVLQHTDPYAGLEHDRTAKSCILSLKLQVFTDSTYSYLLGSCLTNETSQQNRSM